MKRDFSEFKSFIRGKKVAVVGIGISNIPLIHFLVRLGASVTAFDKKDKSQLEDVIKSFKDEKVNFELGGNYLDRLKGFDVVFKTPSMRVDCDALVNIKNEGAYITSEMEEFVKYCPCKVYGVTGSDGKTTTTSIIYNLLKEQGYKTWIGGNIGMPLFSQIEDMTKDDKVVLELSSFQLMTMDCEVDVAIVTNLSPNHLDIHKDMNEYIEAKKNIFKYQKQNDLLIINDENKITKTFDREAKGKVLKFSSQKVIEDGGYYKDGQLFIKGKKICDKDDIVIRGMHNVENYLAAFLAVNECVDSSVMRKVAMTFEGVEHRMEFVRELDGVKYYNDSIASSPTRTLASLKGYGEKCILIAGGYDKHIPFDPLAFEGYPYIKTVIIMGLTKDKIKASFDKLEAEKGIKVPYIIVSNLEEAVSKAKDISKNGDVVTLSPACASFDMFANFEVRGKKFKELVKLLK
ncbi:UDP-N-acetylmuramoyl-L-alanine--D-glutamate ligase [Clostridium fallax]|uniref:UDP-N-acetylmuramoylalanine--D-glutamate ligase n=1 Tax=Clostridium fallax TaxID=1533 RepID=A0A1M4TFV8_9CLOT|nr:UDP-N-acetylmuramoyl-L-alanine--D-glutamate ligase [Clostridium fallax]SHE43353.1 UDP-N-acetylmuramoylalanine--D-glutamate ligase [Clostridium fallax]SQB22741.1 UDP-N-acetylmuramoyl-L-alanyl-D-glutamate synthetase [Clostridium fallax]